MVIGHSKNYMQLTGSSQHWDNPHEMGFGHVVNQSSPNWCVKNCCEMLWQIAMMDWNLKCALELIFGQFIFLQRLFETGNVIDKLFYGCLVCSKRQVGLEFGASPSHYTATPGNSEVKACPSACSLLLAATNLPNSKIEGYKSTIEWDFALLVSYLFFSKST